MRTAILAYEALTLLLSVPVSVVLLLYLYMYIRGSKRDLHPDAPEKISREIRNIGILHVAVFLYDPLPLLRLNIAVSHFGGEADTTL